MSAWPWAALAVAAIGCGGQSFADGVAALCDAPSAAQLTSEKPADRAARLATWIEAHVDNAEVRALIDGLARAPMRRRAVDLAAAVRRAGLDRCGGETADQLASAGYFGADIPDVGSGAGLVPAADRVPDVVVTTRDIVVGDNRVVAVGSNGDVDPSEKEGGAFGIQIDVLRNAAGTILPEHRAGATDIALAIDRRTSYALLIEVLYTLAHAHGPTFTFGMLATSGDAVGYLPIKLPERAPPSQDGMPTRLGLIVTETPTGIQLWSVSGDEGSLPHPKLDLHGLDDLRPLHAALEEIVQRRWPTGQREPLDHQIILMLDSTMPVQRFLELAAVVRVGSHGDELFDDILLSTGLR